MVSADLLFPFITGKNFLWRTLIECALVGWASLAILDPRYRIDWRNPIFLSFSLFMLTMMVANLFGVDSVQSFWSNAERMDGYIGLLHMFGFFIAGFGFMRVQYTAGISFNIVVFVLVVISMGVNFQSLFVDTTQPHDLRALIQKPEHITLVQHHHPTAFTALQTTYGFACNTASGSCSLVDEQKASERFIRFLQSRSYTPLLAFVLAMGGVLLLFGLMVQTASFVHRYVHVLLMIAMILGVVALFQLKPRADAVLGNPIYLASFMSFAFFACVYFGTFVENLWKHAHLRQVMYGLPALFFLYIIIQTGTRGAVLGLLCGGFTTALCVALTCRETQYVWYRRIAWGVVAATVLVVSLFFSTKSTLAPIALEQLGSDHIATRALFFSLDDTTTKHRLANWEMALEGFAERPILGWGQENYTLVFSKYYQADKLYDAEQWFDRTHNMFLDWLVFGGLLGLGSFLALLFTLIYVVWRFGQKRLSTMGQSIITGVIVTYMAQNFVAFDALATGIWILTFCILIALIYSPATDSKQKALQIPEVLQAMFIVLLWILMLVWMSISIWGPRQELVSLLKVLYSRHLGTEQRTEILENYLPVLDQTLNKQSSIFGPEILEQLLARHQVYTGEELSPELQKAYLTVVARGAEKYIESNSFNTRVALYYGNLLNHAEQYQEALGYYERALSTSPDKVSILQTIGQTYLAMGETHKALEYFERASVLAPQDQRFQESLKNFKEELSQ